MMRLNSILLIVVVRKSYMSENETRKLQEISSHLDKR